MSLHATPIEVANLQHPDAAKSFRNDFFDKYPDLLPYESVVYDVAAKLKANGYKGESREAKMETYAAAARLELAQQQRSPPISETQVPTDTEDKEHGKAIFLIYLVGIIVSLCTDNIILCFLTIIAFFIHFSIACKREREENELREMKKKIAEGNKLRGY
jgi:hypothetical protein